MIIFGWGRGSHYIIPPTNQFSSRNLAWDISTVFGGTAFMSICDSFEYDSVKKRVKRPRQRNFSFISSAGVSLGQPPAIVPGSGLLVMIPWPQGAVIPGLCRLARLSLLLWDWSTSKWGIPTGSRISTYAAYAFRFVSCSNLKTAVCQINGSPLGRLGWCNGFLAELAKLHEWVRVLLGTPFIRPCTTSKQKA